MMREESDKLEINAASMRYAWKKEKKLSFSELHACTQDMNTQQSF